MIFQSIFDEPSPGIQYDITGIIIGGRVLAFKFSSKEKTNDNSENKSEQGATRFELVTSRSAVECSTTELYPHLLYNHVMSVHISSFSKFSLTYFLHTLVKVGMSTGETNLELHENIAKVSVYMCISSDLVTSIQSLTARNAGRMCLITFNAPHWEALYTSGQLRAICWLVCQLLGSTL